ncbi:MAG: peptidoglycan-binding protein [Mesorhizobium sp.]|nr:peptidoglycan-binding protein [Mesorhizobium sp.]MBL8575751.1 peptidoglycan-binding protein [Mesorhizobium sp.]
MANGRLARFLLVFFTMVPVFGNAAEDNAVVAESLRAMFQSGAADTGSAEANADLDAIRDIYVVRDFKPIWVRDEGPKTKAKALLSELKISGVNGLSPSFYRVADIEALMGSADPGDLARLDMLLSGAAVDFGGDLANGRIGPSLAPSENAVEPLPITPAEYVAGAEAAENLRDFAGALLSEDYRYVRLIAKLSEFSRIEASGRWPVIDAAGAEIAAGSSDPRIKDMRMLLMLSGDLPLTDLSGGAFDGGMADAVRLFQTRHGLPPTGDIDRATLIEMAVPVSERIRQIKVNLERRRWQNRDLGPDHVYINLAAGEVKVVQAGRSEVFVNVTGAPGTLPTFQGEILGFDVDAAANVALDIRSPFIDRIGGDAGERAIAVSDIGGLAAMLAAKRVGEADALDAALAAGKPSKIVFDDPLPLFVTFVTAWANRDGTVHFRRDTQGRDAMIAKLLQLD